MSEASTFATAAPAATSTASTLDSGVSSDKSATTNTAVGDLLYTYEDETKNPYVADYLDIKSVWDKEPMLKREVSGLEDYLRKMVVSKKIENNTRAAKQYLEFMEKQAGIEPFESANRRISKLTKYIAFRKVVDG
jgi:hypothetical protein